MIQKFLFVGLGGFLGSILRYMISNLIQSTNKIGTFPIGTLTVNLLGCFGLSFFFYYFEQKGCLAPHHSALLLAGFFGAFTTFSTFELEIFNLLSKETFLSGLFYLSISLVGGLSLIWVGKEVAQLLSN